MKKTKFGRFMNKYFKWMMLGDVLFLCFALVVPKGRIVEITIDIPKNEEVEKVPMTPEQLPESEQEA